MFPLASTIKVVASSSTDKFSPKSNSLAFVTHSSIPLPLAKVDGFHYPYPVFFNTIEAIFFRFGNEGRIRAERCSFLNVFPLSTDFTSFVSHLFPIIVRQYKRFDNWFLELEKVRRRLAVNVVLDEEELLIDLPRFITADLPVCFVVPYKEALPFQRGTLTRAWFRSILSFLSCLDENRLSTYTDRKELLTNKKVRNALLWSELNYPEDNKRFIDVVTVGRKILAVNQKAKVAIDKNVFSITEDFLRQQYLDESLFNALCGIVLYSTVETLLLNGRPLMRKYPRDTPYQKASFKMCEITKEIVKQISSL